MSLLPLIIKILLALLHTIQPVVQPALPSYTSYEASYDNLGIPLEDYYNDGIRARTAWDIEVYNDKLFVASGDYDANSGPVHIYEYGLSNKTWTDNTTVADEQIERFIMIDDTLMAPGCDPRQDWSYGNIYRYENNSWQTYRTIPGGIHQFDMVQFDGRLFVGLGVTPGECPIAVSDDGGNSFQKAPMYKDGIPLDTTITEGTSAQIRVHDFFILNQTLYAFFFRYTGSETVLQIYKYDNGAFHYHSDLPGKLSFKRISYEIFNAKAEFNGTMFFTTGNLYTSTDMITAKHISFGKNTVVPDLRVVEGNLYALVVAPTEDGQYRSSIWCKSTAANQFKEVFYFTFPCPAQSFTYHSEAFYFGMGDGLISDQNSANGTVLKIIHPVD